MYLYLWLNINLKFRTMKQIGRKVPLQRAMAPVIYFSGVNCVLVFVLFLPPKSLGK